MCSTSSVWVLNSDEILTGVFCRLFCPFFHIFPKVKLNSGFVFIRKNIPYVKFLIKLDQELSIDAPMCLYLMLNHWRLTLITRQFVSQLKIFLSQMYFLIFVNKKLCMNQSCICNHVIIQVCFANHTHMFSIPKILGVNFKIILKYM